jgi:hypothetical protein
MTRTEKRVTGDDAYDAFSTTPITPICNRKNASPPSKHGGQRVTIMKFEDQQLEDFRRSEHDVVTRMTRFCIYQPHTPTRKGVQPEHASYASPAGPVKP